MHHTACALVIALGCLLATPALAQHAIARPSLALGDPHPRAPESAHGGLDWALDVEATGSLPLGVGAELVLSTPIGLTAQLGFTHTPSAFLHAAADVLASAQVYDANADPLVRELADRGVWSVRAGLGLTTTAGFELALGYTQLEMGGPLSVGALESATGQSMRFLERDSVPFGVELHALSARIGWLFVIDPHVVVRAALGWTHVVAASAHFGLPPELAELAANVQDEIRSQVTTHGYAPELILAAGYRL